MATVDLTSASAVTRSLLLQATLGFNFRAAIIMTGMVESCTTVVLRQPCSSCASWSCFVMYEAYRDAVVVVNSCRALCKVDPLGLPSLCSTMFSNFASVMWILQICMERHKDTRRRSSRNARRWPCRFGMHSVGFLGPCRHGLGL
jgi:hypothetical protein